jgi:hypothetical protein
LKRRTQLLEDGPHGVVVHPRVLHRAVAVEHGVRAQVDVGVEELLDEGAERVGLGECGRCDVPELEVLEDVLDVLREPVEVVLEVGLEAAAGCPRDLRSRRLNFDVL